MHVSEPKIAALETVSELGVIESQQVQHSCVEVVHVDFILDGVEPQFVGLT